MAAERSNERTALLVENEQPRIAIPVDDCDHSGVRYRTDEALADDAFPSAAAVEALFAIGSWSDLDWVDFLHALDHREPGG